MSRVLYLCSEAPLDFTQDLTYAGLAETLGKSRVVDFPRQPPYHEAGGSYPFDCGYTAGPDPALDWPDIVAALRQGSFDLVVVASTVDIGALRWLAKLREEVRDLPPQVLLDGSDDAGYLEEPGTLYREVVARRPFDAIFKRELHAAGSGDVEPLPFCFCARPELLEALDRSPQHDVFLSMRPTSDLRRQIGSAMRSSGIPHAGDGVVSAKPGRLTRWRRRLRRTFGLPVGWRYAERLTTSFRSTGLDYLRAIARSRIAISAGGKGFDTLRYWEIPFCGAMLLSQRPSIVIPEDFEDGVHAVFFDDAEDLLEKLHHYIGDVEASARIARAGREHLLSHHTTTHRARYLLDVVAQRTGVKIL